MPSLTIKNIPDRLYKSLKQSAKTHHRSINSEAIYCIERMLGSARVDPESFLQEIELLQKQFKGPKLTDRFLKKAKSEGRQ